MFVISQVLVGFTVVRFIESLTFSQVYEISMSTVIKMECDDCSKGKYVEEETISHIREKVDLFKTLHMGWRKDLFKTLHRDGKICEAREE